MRLPEIGAPPTILATLSLPSVSLFFRSTGSPPNRLVTLRTPLVASTGSSESSSPDNGTTRTAKSAMDVGQSGHLAVIEHGLRAVRTKPVRPPTGELQQFRSPVVRGR